MRSVRTRLPRSVPSRGKLAFKIVLVSELAQRDDDHAISVSGLSAFPLAEIGGDLLSRGTPDRLSCRRHLIT
jgi:hypothetical protein